MRIYIVFFLLAVGSISCNNWLDVTPKNERPHDEYWQTKEDVLNSIGATYNALRDCQDNILDWGELRSDMLDVGPGTKEDERADAEEIRDFEISVTNDIAKWDAMYKVINNANAVIQNAPIMLTSNIDPTFTPELCKQYVAEALALRSLAYFYLVRTFRHIPFITEPYLSDANHYANPKQDGTLILDSLTKDLEWAVLQLPSSDADASALWEKTSRFNRWSTYTLLADIYLWQGNYAACIDACSKVEQSNQYGLAGPDNWFTNFYPGYNVEMLFSLYYNHEDLQRNSLFSWFDSKDKARYYVSSYAMSLFNENYDDIRGEFVSFYNDASVNKVWKYLGAEASRAGGNLGKRPTEERSPNWIFYRYADIVLMKAEAFLLQENYIGGLIELNRVRKRAGLSNIEGPTFLALSIEERLQLLLNERRKEFFAEGKIWFDIVRLGIRDNRKYYHLLEDEILRNVSVSNRPIWKTKLADENSLFLPIHYDEISSSDGVLVQNPYYQQ